ncbi:type II secretion system F family protein [Lactonifactor longoviformis]|uniref:Type II secretion system protein F (GspF) n=1 Tax=Lactonifactor longoviformis DSM 17459 TaxID=1122155 RepID=A0A1M4UDT8_9CLOT|nr:type II secretion system F family protein [Lactonifactor longoviformis]POP31422.1 type II secretion system F family protein [Lactonifactor longoviformis]SHE54932.1 type II secretion system protein F (GspF) [Lactonifactor longoviformis DSM 17459]
MAQDTRIKPLTNTELASFCSQMAMILKAGISSVEGITIMLEDAGSSQEKEILRIICDTLQTTGNFRQALEETGAFPSHMLHMAELGEQSGRLDEVMDSLSRYYEREESVAQSIKSAVTYPFIMIGMMLIIIIVLIVKVLPIFNQVFLQLGQEMTGFSRGLMNLGKVLGRYSYVFIGILFVLFLIYLYFAKGKSGKKRLTAFLSAFPLTRELWEKMASGRFAGGMALTLSSGLDTHQSMELASALADNPKVTDKIKNCMELMDTGVDVSQALSDSHLFTGLYSRMISVGFKTGALETVMEKIASLYEEEVDSHINRMISVLEPTLVAVLSIIVGMILLSVILPLMGIMSSL